MRLEIARHCSLQMIPLAKWGLPGHCLHGTRRTKTCSTESHSLLRLLTIRTMRMSLAYCCAGGAVLRRGICGESLSSHWEIEADCAKRRWTSSTVVYAGNLVLSCFPALCDSFAKAGVETRASLPTFPASTPRQCAATAKKIC